LFTGTTIACVGMWLQSYWIILGFIFIWPLFDLFMSKEIKHICLTDDDPDDCYLFSHALKEVNKDIKYTCFSKCEDLLRFLKDGKELPDVLLLDMNMPGNNGVQCLQKIKSEAAVKHIPVMIYSTASSPSVIASAHEFGAERYLTKPSSVAALKELIKELLK
jgi:CheY-like chemotaxis protein